MARFDFAAALAQQREQDRQRQTAALFAPATERIVLGTVLANDAIEDRVPYEFADRVPVLVLEECDGRLVDVGVAQNLEPDDFGDFRYRAAFKAIRNLVARNSTLPDMVDIADEIEHSIVARGGSVQHTGFDGNRIDAAWLADIATAPWPWGPAYQPRVSTSWLVGKLAHLRHLAQLRRSV